ncbi:MAG: hypothetical protein Q9172_003416 [Xanthocarpia lactea]
MSSIHPSNSLFALTEKKLGDSLKKAEDDSALVRVDRERHLEEEREKNPEDYDLDLKPIQSPIFIGQENKIILEKYIAGARHEMSLENQKAAAAELEMASGSQAEERS